MAASKYPDDYPVMTYTQRVDGEWVDVTNGHYFACCYCGLVHLHEHRIIKAESDGELRILEKANRDNRATANRRRSLKAQKEGLWAKKR